MKTARNNGAMRRLMVAGICLGVTMLLGGCLKRQAPPTFPPILHAPEPAPPPPAPPEMDSSLSEDISTLPPIKVTEIKPRPRRRITPRSPAVDTSTPVDTTSAEPVPEDTSIGELSAGGGSNAKTQQEANNLIASSERKLNGLAPVIIHQQQAQVRKVRYFLKQAHQALSTGDAEGAKTLATKATLLIDDMVK